MVVDDRVQAGLESRRAGEVDRVVVAGRGLSDSIGVSTDLANRAAFLRARAVTLQRLRLEPCFEDGESMGYLLALDWDWEHQKFNRSRQTLAKEQQPKAEKEAETDKKE